MKRICPHFVVALFLGALPFLSCDGDNDSTDVRSGYDASYDLGMGGRSVTWSDLAGSEGDDAIADVATAASGDVFVVGTAAGAGALGDGSFEGGDTDGFVARYSPDGERAWLEPLGTPGSDTANGIAVDDGAVYVAGSTSGGLGDASFNGGNWDAFVSKFDTSGTRQWVRLLGTSSGDRAWEVAAGPDSAIYLAGETEEALNERSFNGGPDDAYVAKYTRSGDLEWVRLAGSEASDGANSVAATPSGDVYIAGFTEGDLGGRSHNGGEEDGFVAKYDAAGDRKWARLVGSSQSQRVWSAEATDSGAVFVSGRTDGGFGGETYRGGEWDGFTAKYSSTGESEWTRLIGGNGWEEANSIAAGPEGLLVAGVAPDSFGGAVFRGGENDGFVVTYDTSGERTSAAMVGGTDWDTALGVAADSDGGFIAVGKTKGDVGGESHAGGEWDGFVMAFE